MIQVKNLSKHFHGRLAVDNISFRVPEASTLVLLGTSGSGKTTTLRMINRLTEPSAGEILIAGIAGLVAGAMSMAAGEYVSVSSQSDTEKADIARETSELAGDRDAEVAELAGIYAARGLDPDLSRQVALQLMEKDALGAHARDELGISEFSTARPVQAAVTSALTFALGALPPLLLVLWAPLSGLIVWVAVATLAGLMGLGALGAVAGGADVRRSVLRVAFWGVTAMAATAGIGRLFGTVV